MSEPAETQEPRACVAPVLLPVSPERAEAFAKALCDYARCCAAVKRALMVEGDDGASYRAAREDKHAQFNTVLGVVEGLLAHIGVHAKD